MGKYPYTNKIFLCLSMSQALPLQQTAVRRKKATFCFACCACYLRPLFVVIFSSGDGRRQLHLWNICPFIVSFFGTIINAASPGSLRRNRITMDEEGIRYGLINEAVFFHHQKKKSQRTMQSDAKNKQKMPPAGRFLLR